MPAAAPVTITTFPRRPVSMEGQSTAAPRSSPGSARRDRRRRPLPRRRPSPGRPAWAGRGRGRARGRRRRRRRPPSSPPPARPGAGTATRSDAPKASAPRGPRVTTTSRSVSPAIARPAAQGSARNAGGRSDSEPTRTWAGREPASSGGTWATTRLRARRLREELAQVEVAAAHVDGVGLERGEARAAAPASRQRCEVDDRALAAGVHEDERARAVAGDAGDRGDVDPRRLQLREQPLRDRVGADAGRRA